jgi:hypothetical protein
VGPDRHQQAGSPIGTSSDRPGDVERIRRLWEAGVGEVTSGEWRVTSLKKKQIPRYARNDNSLGFGRAVRRGVERVLELGPDWRRAVARVEVGKMRIVGERGRVALGLGRAESGSHSYL